MKQKNKTITLILIFSIFLTAMNTIAYSVDISNIDYPESVREGDILKIVVSFDYEYVSSELYGGCIFLIYDITSSSDILLGTPTTVDVPITKSTPSKVVISVATSSLVSVNMLQQSTQIGTK
jgi:hypothetical protein